MAVVLAAKDTTGLDVATAIVAGYAALVATLALTFQVFQWLRTWQTRVVVDLRPMRMAQAGEASEAVVLFELVNHSGHRVKITNVGLTPVKRGGKPCGSRTRSASQFPAHSRFRRATA